MFEPARRKGQSALNGNTRILIKYVACYVVFIVAGCMLTFSADAASFVIADGQVVTTGQTLNDNETGKIQLGGQLNTGASDGINAPGDDVSINNSGMISTTWYNADGIYSSGANVSINNSGMLLTTGNSAAGIVSIDANASIINSGTLLHSGGGGGAGIISYRTNASINNSGMLSTTRNGTEGIFSLGENVSINNNGTLSTMGDDAPGIHSFDDNASINNNGTLSTMGNDASGIHSSGDNASMNNNGTLSTTGDYADGIHSSGFVWAAPGDNSSTNNSEILSTTEDFSDGIHPSNLLTWVISGANVSINNSGTLSTTGDFASGIHSSGADASINNSGTLSTTGDFASGIHSSGADASINNNGTLSTTGDNADGIYSSGANASVKNNGTIQVTGTNSIGIRSRGTDGVMTISGNVFATGSATQAIVGGNNQTLNLLPGFCIIGSINLGSGTNTVNISGGKTSSSTLTIDNLGTINLLGDVPIVRNGNLVAVIDPTTQTANRAALSLTMDSINQVVNQQLMNMPPSKPVQVATTQLLPGMLHQDSRPYVWGHLFGGYREREDDENALAYEHDMYGFVCGYENTIAQHRVGVFAGVAQSDIETDTDSIEIDTDRFFIGAYGQHVMGNWILNGSVMVGYGDHDNDRTVLDNLSGFETARSDYDSLSISPSLTLIRTYECKSGIELRPSAQLAYTYAYFDDYIETGTTRSNLRVDSRDVNIVSGRLQLAGSYPLPNERGEVALRGGIKLRHYGNDSVHVNFNGSQLSYTTTGDNNVLGGYFGANARYRVKDRLNLVGNVEYGQASGDEKSISGNLGLTFSF